MKLFDSSVDCRKPTEAIQIYDSGLFVLNAKTVPLWAKCCYFLLVAVLPPLVPFLNNPLFSNGFSSAGEFGSSGESSALISPESGAGICVPHRARIFAAWKLLAARRVKSTGILGSIGMNVTTTGINVPGVNAGIKTTALIGVPTTVSDCKPLPALT